MISAFRAEEVGRNAGTTGAERLAEFSSPPLVWKPIVSSEFSITQRCNAVKVFRYNGAMQHRISAHIRLLWLFARRCIIYNLALSLLGASALFAVSLASADATQPLLDSAGRVLRVAAMMGAILVMTVGQTLGLVAMRLFHGRELPYYRNAGLGEGVLAVGAWAVALVVGAVLLIAGMMWT
ncbi:MAG: hypothetical protein V3S41_07245 [Spirochaetia bacterium]